MLYHQSKGTIDPICRVPIQTETFGIEKSPYAETLCDTQAQEGQVNMKELPSRKVNWYVQGIPKKRFLKKYVASIPSDTFHIN